VYVGWFCFQIVWVITNVASFCYYGMPQLHWITFTSFGKWHFAFALMPIELITQLPLGWGYFF